MSLVSFSRPSLRSASRLDSSVAPRPENCTVMPCDRNEGLPGLLLMLLRRGSGSGGGDDGSLVVRWGFAGLGAVGGRVADFVPRVPPAIIPGIGTTTGVRLPKLLPRVTWTSGLGTGASS